MTWGCPRWYTRTFIIAEKCQKCKLNQLQKLCLPVCPGVGVYTPPRGQTGTCENITFPQLLLRTVINLCYVIHYEFVTLSTGLNYLSKRKKKTKLTNNPPPPPAIIAVPNKKYAYMAGFVDEIYSNATLPLPLPPLPHHSGAEHETGVHSWIC